MCRYCQWLPPEDNDLEVFSGEMFVTELDMTLVSL